MKDKKIKTLLLFLLLIPYLLNASQKHADIFSNYIESDVFDLNKYSLKETVKIHLKNNKNIKAFVIYENKEKFLSGYLKNDELVYKDVIPETFLKLKKYSSAIVFDDINIGRLVIYFDESYNNLLLTSEEKKYIKEKKEITMCVDPNWMPYESINKNEYIGIGSEYIKLFSKKLNIHFSLIPTKSWSESTLNAKNKVCDILPLSSNSEKRKEFMYVTTPHLVEAIVLVTKVNTSFIVNPEDLKNKKIGITKGYSIIETFSKNYPYLEIVETRNIEDGLKMVEKGELFGQIDAISTMNYYINKSSPNKFIISSKFNETYNLGIASNGDDMILHNILQKMVQSISLAEHNKIYYKWNSEKVVIEKSNYKLVFQVFVVFIVLILFILYWNRKLQKLVDERTLEIKSINESLEERIKTEVEKNRKNELKILEQAKLASLGDMIGNIAHQWRQPLSIISLSSTGALFQKKMGLLDDKTFEDEMNLINKNAQYLSTTIDTFRNFLSESKEIREVKVLERVKNALNILTAALKNNQIEIKEEFLLDEDFILKMAPDELPQVIINIVNNSKDILVENKIEKPWIKILVKKDLDNVLISIEDNGGGVPESIISRVFEPYFTTKHKSKGTGLGLNMSYRIIVESLNGKLYVENTNNGAKFLIELPIVQDL